MRIRNSASLWQHYHFITLLCFRAGLLRLENAAGQLFHSFDKRCRPARSTGTGLFQESLNIVILIFLCEKSPPVQTAFKNQRKLRFLAAGFEQRVSLLQAKTVPGARPAIIPRMLHLGKNTNRIALNIPNAGKQIRTIQGTGKETTLKEKAPNPIAKINHAGIEAMGLSYGTGKTLLLLRDNHQMNMIIHQTVRHDMQTEPVTLLPHEPEILEPVFIREKDIQRSYAPLGDMMGISRDHYPCHSRHNEILSKNSGQEQELTIMSPELGAELGGNQENLKERGSGVNMFQGGDGGAAQVLDAGQHEMAR